MENASKALIMAGAILIAILLISAGLIILNSTKGVTEQGGRAAKTLEVETFNSQFTKYCGDRVLGSKVTDLRNFVQSFNKANNKEIKLNFIDIETIIPNQYYTITIGNDEYDANGYVTGITIKQYKPN